MIILSTIYTNIFDQPLFIFYLAVVITDFITGNIKAIINQEWSSSNGTTGSLKHLALLAFVVLFLPTLSHVLESNVLSLSILSAITLQNTGSIYENLKAMGYDLTALKGLEKYFKNVDEKED